MSRWSRRWLCSPTSPLVRRLLLEFTPWKSTDPLLLVAPAVLVLVLARLYVIERRPLVTDLLSKLMLFLLALTFLEAFNPRGGGLKAGVGRAALHGRAPSVVLRRSRVRHRTRSLRVLFIPWSVSACLIAAYGLVQTWSGLPAWDQLWVNTTGYAALNVGNVIRAFGTFSSAAEYASFLGIAIVTAVAFALDRRPYLLPAVPLLAVALFYESSRGIVVTTVVGSAGRARRANGKHAPRNRDSDRALSACVVVALVLERGALQSASSSSNALVAHQLSGLVHPLSAKQSTLPTHLNELETGFRAWRCSTRSAEGSPRLRWREPSSATNRSFSTEVDLSNAFVADGTFGGLAYLAIVVLVLAAALRHAVARRDAVSLTILGMLVALMRAVAERRLLRGLTARLVLDRLRRRSRRAKEARPAQLPKTRI